MEDYDVYYSTGGGSLVAGGSDVWVNYWTTEVAPKLKYPSKLLIHRAKPELSKPQKEWYKKNEFKNSGKQVHTKMVTKVEETKKVIVKTRPQVSDTHFSLEHVWQGDDPRKFEEIAKNARRIHILHGYYTPHRIIEENKDKIASVVLHVSVDLSLKAAVQLGLKHIHHFSASGAWEKEVIKWADKIVWIGINDVDLHKEYDIINIPNFYEFKNNRDITMNDTIGFAARTETRKSVHYLENHESLAFTVASDIKWWRKELGFKFPHTKIIQFRYDLLNRFLDRDDWGISHSCFLNEPFGYSIFEAVDFGKLPILSVDWCSEYDYPFRAANHKEFDEIVDKIKGTSKDERQKQLVNLRNYLKGKFSNKKEWTEKYLQIYND